MDCIGHEYRSLTGQLTSRVVPRKKQISGIPLLPLVKEGKKRQFLPDLPERLRYKETRRRGQSESQRGGKRRGVAHLLVLPRLLERGFKMDF